MLSKTVVSLLDEEDETGKNDFVDTWLRAKQTSDVLWLSFEDLFYVCLSMTSNLALLRPTNICFIRDVWRQKNAFSSYYTYRIVRAFWGSLFFVNPTKLFPHCRFSFGLHYSNRSIDTCKMRWQVWRAVRSPRYSGSLCKLTIVFGIDFQDRNTWGTKSGCSCSLGPVRPAWLILLRTRSHVGDPGLRNLKSLWGFPLNIARVRIIGSVA